MRPIEKDFNERLSASVRDLDGGISAALERITGGTVADGRIVARETKFKETVLPHPSGRGTLELADEIYEELRTALSRPERGGEFLSGTFPAPIQAKLAEFSALEAAEVAGAAVEESVVITAEGELLRRTGKVDEVDWIGVNMRGSLMTHTHPSGGTLGPADIVLAMGRAMAGVRAHAGSRIYSVKPGLKAKVFADKSELMGDSEYYQAYTEAWAVVEQMSRDYNLDTLEIRKEAATHLTWIGLERKGWIVYHVEKP